MAGQPKPVPSIGRASQADAGRRPVQLHPPTAQSPGVTAPAGRRRFAPGGRHRFPPAGAGRRALVPISVPTRIDVTDAGRAIGTQYFTATQKGFFLALRPAVGPTRGSSGTQDYERLRLSHELSREICMERDLAVAPQQDPHRECSSFVRADRGLHLSF